MKTSLIVGLIAGLTSVAAHAETYKPGDRGETVYTVNLTVDRNNEGYGCEIGLRQPEETVKNVELMPGEVAFKPFRDAQKRGKIEGAELAELQELSLQVEVTNDSEKLEIATDTFVSYHLRVENPKNVGYISRNMNGVLAYDASFDMVHPAGFQHVVKSQANSQMKALVSLICSRLANQTPSK